MPVTTNFQIPYPDGNSNYTPLQDWFAAIANGTETALNTGLGGAPRIATSDAARNALYPAPVQGNTVVRPDKGYTEQYFGLYDVGTNPGGLTVAGWAPISGRGFRRELAFKTTGPTQLAEIVSGAGWTNFTAPETSATITATGLPIRVTWSIFIQNGTSSSPRYMLSRVRADNATNIAPEVLNNVVSYLTTQDAVVVSQTAQHTPTAGSHTYNLQGWAGTASAIYLRGATLQIEEVLI